jgi:hypothetical protein
MAPSPPQCLCRGHGCSRGVLQTCAEVSASPKFDDSYSQSRSMLRAPRLLLVHSGVRANARGESVSTFQSSRGGWEHLEGLRRTGKGCWTASEVCCWLPDRITFCSYLRNPAMCVTVSLLIQTTFRTMFTHHYFTAMMLNALCASINSLHSDP